jgi:hypothetical protein
MNIRSLILLALCGLPALTLADLSGTWRGNDGGTYYLRQDGSKLYWYGERGDEDPVWSNVFVGKVARGTVTGNWMDVPKGRARNEGELALKITNSGNTLKATRKTGGFGGSTWNRNTGWERNINRAGQDFKNFELGRSDPKLCQSACNKENRCMAWTYVKPRVQGPKAKCWLKHAIPEPRFSTCCVSGVVKRKPTLPTDRVIDIGSAADRLRRHMQPRGVEPEVEPALQPERP